MAPLEGAAYDSQYGDPKGSPYDWSPYDWSPNGCGTSGSGITIFVNCPR